MNFLNATSFAATTANDVLIIAACAVLLILAFILFFQKG